MIRSYETVSLCGSVEWCAASGKDACACGLGASPDGRCSNIQSRGGAMRARSRLRAQRRVVPLWAGCKDHRVSIPAAPPSSGVSSTPSGRHCPMPQPVSAARCRRRTGVMAGGVSKSATTKGAHPARKASSIAQSASAARPVRTNRRSDGLIHSRGPAECARQSSYRSASSW